MRGCFVFSPSFGVESTHQSVVLVTVVKKSVSSFSMIRDMILLRKLEGILERIDALGGSFFWKNSNR